MHYAFPLSLILAFLFTGCVQKHDVTTPLPSNDLGEPLAQSKHHAPKVLHGDQPSDLAAIIRDAEDARVLFVGERHDRLEHHLNQLAVLKAVHEEYPDVAIGVEWFQRPFQSVLDDYIQGRIDESELLLASEYLDRWAYDFRMMKPILDYAKRHSLTVMALNADTQITRKIGQSGLSGLSPAERLKMPARISPMPDNERADIEAIFKAHAQPQQGNIEHFIMVQRVWDLAMTEGIVDHLEAHPERKMLVFTGEGHSAKGRAIPKVLATLKPDWKSLVMFNRTPDVKLESNPDYWLISPALELPPIGTLGVWLGDEQSPGAWVKKVLDSSAAEQAGLRENDRIIALNDKPTHTSSQLKIQLGRHAPGDLVILHIQRAGQQHSLTATLQ